MNNLDIEIILIKVVTMKSNAPRLILRWTFVSFPWTKRFVSIYLRLVHLDTPLKKKKKNGTRAIAMGGNLSRFLLRSETWRNISFYEVKTVGDFFLWIYLVNFSHIAVPIRIPIPMKNFKKIYILILF